MISRNVALILAAGRGSRLGGKLPKQYLKISNKPILTLTINRFLQNKNIDLVQVIINEHDVNLYSSLKLKPHPKLLPYVIGGDERFDSARIGLENLAKYNPDKVLIHDGCRPFVSDRIIEDVVLGLDRHDCVIPVVKVTDSLKNVKQGVIISSIDRENIYCAQTPQGIKFTRAIKLYRNSAESFTDDASIFEISGIKAHTVPGSGKNIKITTPEDIELAKILEE